MESCHLSDLIDLASSVNRQRLAKNMPAFTFTSAPFMPFYGRKMSSFCEKGLDKREGETALLKEEKDTWALTSILLKTQKRVSIHANTKRESERKLAHNR